MAATGMATPLTSGESIPFFGFGDDALQRLEQLAIPGIGLPGLEGSPEGLATGLAMSIPRGVEDGTESFAGPEMAGQDPAVLDFSRVVVENLERAFSGVEFSPREARAAERLMPARDR